MNNRRNCRFGLTYKHYMYGPMDYNFQQVPIYCRVCGQRLTKYRAIKRTSSECIAFSAELKIAFDIDTFGNDVHPEMFCKQCKLAMERTICAITK